MTSLIPKYVSGTPPKVRFKRTIFSQRWMACRSGLKAALSAKPLAASLEKVINDGNYCVCRRQGFARKAEAADRSTANRIACSIEARGPQSSACYCG